MFHEIIVVEGRHDEQKLKSIYQDVECIVTGGSAVSDETLELIKQASLSRGVILLLDPDFPGKQITNKILQVCTKGNVKIASLQRSLAYSKNRKKIGVEHATNEDIINCLANVVTLNTKNKVYNIQLSDLIERNLAQTDFSKERRTGLCKKLNIPYLNGKTFLKYLHMMDMSLSRLDDLLK